MNLPSCAKLKSKILIFVRQALERGKQFEVQEERDER